MLRQHRVAHAWPDARRAYFTIANPANATHRSQVTATGKTTHASTTYVLLSVNSVSLSVQINDEICGTQVRDRPRNASKNTVHSKNSVKHGYFVLWIDVVVSHMDTFS